MAKGLSPVAKVLKPALIAVFKDTDVVRLIVDGLDEIEATEHKPVLRELKRLTEFCGETCKLLVASQDIPSIRSMLGKVPQLFLGDENERQAIETDMRVVVDATLTELDESLGGALDAAQKAALRASILSNAEGRDCSCTAEIDIPLLISIPGMFLWINLILTLLEESCSLDELESIVTTLPKDLEQMLVMLEWFECKKSREILGSSFADTYASEGTESFLTESVVGVTLRDCRESRGYLSGFSLPREEAISRNTKFFLVPVFTKTV